MTLNRRAFLASTATVVLAGCLGSSNRPNEDIFEIVNVEVVKQATRVGVKVTVDNGQFAGDTCPFHVELFDDSGEMVRSGYHTVSLGGGDTESATKWWEFDSVDATKAVYAANATVVSDQEYEDETGEYI